MSRKKPSETRQARQFAIILPVILCLLAAGFEFIGGHRVRAVVAVSAAGAAVLCAVVAFPVWLRFFRLWMRFAGVMSVVTSTIILTIFFYLVFTPISVVLRLFGKKMLDRAWKDGRESYWIAKDAPDPSLERYGKQF
ncbi:MAG: SxtJ family membrane protein [Acidobacteriota bacterium]